MTDHPLSAPTPQTRLGALAGAGSWSLSPGQGLRLGPVLQIMLGLGEGLVEAAFPPREVLRLLDRTGRRRILGDLRGLTRSGSAVDRALVVRKDGQRERWFRCHAIGLGDEDAPQTQLRGMVIDITTKKRIAAELRRSYMSAEKAGCMAGVGSWSIDLESNELSWSKEVFRIHDLEPGRQPTIEEAIAYYPEESRKTIEACLDDLVATGTPMDVEVQMRTAKGRQIWVRAMGDVDRSGNDLPQHIYGVFQDITVQHETARQLKEKEERGRLALAGSEDGVWDWLVQEGDVVFSTRYKQMLGYGENELRPDLDAFADLLHPDDAAKTFALVDETLKGEREFYKVEFRMRHKDGSWRWILARGKVVQRDEAGNAVRMVGTHTDIDDQVAVREELVLAKEGAESAAKAKAKFLATMSHEIRTPMNGILGMAQVLLGTDQSDTCRTYIETIIQSGTALLTILNDVLDLSKVESGNLTLETEPFDLQSAMRDIVALLEPAANKKRTTLRLEYPEELPRTFLGDSVRLRQIVMNLVGNAVKFTSSGGTTLRVQELPADDPRLPTIPSQSHPAPMPLIVKIIDTGIGIDTERSNGLFEPFAQADASTTREFGGTGLGLSICRQLVELMGGQIGAFGEPGSGSTFWFTVSLPVAQSKSVRPLLEGIGAPLPREACGTKGSSILVVEDNEVNQLVAHRMIEQLGYEVAVVGNGEQALEAMERDAFDLVLMDCQMPVLDGFEATRRRREQEQAQGLERITIVAMTANALADDRRRCLEAGMDDYITKPVVSSRLAGLLSRHLHATENRA